MISTYQEFLKKVDEFGILSFSGKFIEGFPRLDEMTVESQWHTGDADTDPWQWKDRAAMERKVAFGCILGGKKGFISKAFYPLFFAACRPGTSLEERYYNGTLPKAVKDVYDLIETKKELSTADIHQLLPGKKSAVDKAIVSLQKEFYITVCGNQRRISKAGKEYGWPANTYGKVEDWAGDWIEGTEKMDQKEAQEKIIKHCRSWGFEIDDQKLGKLLFH